MSSEISAPVGNTRRTHPLRVLWFSFFPIERLPGLPPELSNLPRIHPATWQRVLWEQFKDDPNLSLDIVILRNHFPRDFIFQRGNTLFHCIKTPRGMRAGSL